MTKKFQLSDFDPTWIKDEIDENCIQYMEGLGLHLCDKRSPEERSPGFNAVTTSQMRNIFSEIKRIDVKINDDEQWKKEKQSVLLLRPKIAYNTARVLSSKRNSRMTDLRKILEECLSVIESKEDYKRFSQFFEGIIAYHKVYGGRD